MSQEEPKGAPLPASPAEPPNEPLHGGPAWGFARPKPYHGHVFVPGWSGRKRIAHLTDLHFGNVTPLALQKNAVALVNAARPDLTVLTGDFVARGLGHLERLTEVMAAIEGRKLAVLGNHDWWSGAAGVQEALEAAGVEVIDNQWTMDGAGEDALPVVCIDDWTTDHHDVHEAVRGLHGRPALALSHNPEAAPELWAAGAGVVLSGHTHGGQVYVRTWTRSLYQSLLRVRYLNGFYSEEGGQVYVNPGVGSSVVPFRYGRPAQRCVAILDLEGGELRPPEHGF
ncbi:metallophosphoesterase [Myxococcota bacterium]|nr:metallophosphoesterase [Myxococcota bacterium]